MNNSEYEKMRICYRRLCEVANKELVLILDQFQNDMNVFCVESLDNFDLAVLGANVSTLSGVIQNIIECREWFKSHDAK